METEKLLMDISNKLSTLISLSLEKGDKKLTTKDKVRFLNRFNLTSQQIADIIGTSKNTVDVTNSNLKAKNL